MLLLTCNLKSLTPFPILLPSLDLVSDFVIAFLIFVSTFILPRPPRLRAQ